MSKLPRPAQTEGSTTFSPEAFFGAWAKEEITPPYDNDFRKFVLKAFGLPRTDTYVYRATAEVTLLQVQTYLEFGGQGGLHAWYLDAENKPKPPPSRVDIAAYSDIFRPTTSTSKALTALASNAKRDSIRTDVAKHLLALYKPPTTIQIPKSKVHINPYFDVWTWTNQNVEWAGPDDGTHNIKISHAILPVLYHHFGCVCPSYEALEIIKHVTKGRKILDIGSGNGYWTYMLRRMQPASKKEKPLEVVAIDNGVSEWRTVWIPDTIDVDGARWLQQNGNGTDAVLLLVYPQVGESFTSKVLKAYKGTTIVAASTQNANGFTAFADQTIDEWVGKNMPNFEKTVQISLPSFAGKDEALFVFEAKDQSASKA